MKYLSNFSRGVALVMGLVLAMVVSTSQAANNTQAIQGNAEVVDVKGDATFTEPNAKALPVIRGLLLHPGTIVMTGKGSKLELNLAENGNKLVLMENTTLEIKKLEIMKSGTGTDATTELELKKGGLYGNVKKISQASTFQVTYAKGVAGIRGTKWAIMPDGTVVVTEGTVQVTKTDANGKSTTTTLDASNGPVQLPPDGATSVPYSGSDPGAAAPVFDNQTEKHVGDVIIRVDPVSAGDVVVPVVSTCVPIHNFHHHINNNET